MAEEILETIIKSELKDGDDFLSWFLEFFKDSKDQCTIEEFAVFFLNFLRNQTVELLHCNSCNTLKDLQLNNENNDDDNNDGVRCAGGGNDGGGNGQTSSKSEILVRQSSKVTTIDTGDILKSSKTIKKSIKLYGSQTNLSNSINKNNLQNNLQNNFVSPNHHHDISDGKNLPKIKYRNVCFDHDDDDGDDDSLQLRSMTPCRDENVLLQRNLNKIFDSSLPSTSSTSIISSIGHDLNKIQLNNENSDHIEMLDKRNSTTTIIPTTPRNLSYPNITSTPIRKQNRSSGIGNISGKNLNITEGFRNSEKNYSNANSNNYNNNSNNTTKRSPVTHLCLGDFLISPSSRTKRKSSNKSDTNVSPLSIKHNLTSRNSMEPINTVTNQRVKPKKRVVPIKVHPSVNPFTSPAFRSDNNILDLTNDEQILNINFPINCNNNDSNTNKINLISERELLKTQINEIAKEFHDESPSISIQQQQQQLYNTIEKDLKTVFESNQLLSINNNTNKKLRKQKIDLNKITQKLVLEKFINIYSILIDLNLIRNILNEISYLLNLFNIINEPNSDEIDQYHPDEDKTNMILNENEIDMKLINKTIKMKNYFMLFKNLNNCIYFALGVLKKQKHILAMFDAITLKVILDNVEQHFELFAKDLKLFLTDIYLYKIKLETIKPNQDHSFSINNKTFNNVFYQEENDTRHNFPSDREFSAFRKQRDLFYSILKTWEYKHLNPSWNFSHELGSKIQNLLLVMDHPINMTHLAKLFTSQLIISSKFNDASTDLEISLPNIDPSKLTKLHQRLIQPSQFSIDYQFPGYQAFFRDFILNASNFIVFAEQIKITLISELIEMNDSSYDIVNLSISSENEKIYNEYVVRPETITTMRILSKFLGLVMSRPFNYDGIRNSHVDNRQIELRNMVQPTFDVMGILKKSITERKLIITIPWIVQYISMLDYVTLRLVYYRKLMHLLYEIYMKLTTISYDYSDRIKHLDNICTPDNYGSDADDIIENISIIDLLQMRPTSIFILRSCLGWLFENPNISEEFYNYRQNRNYQIKFNSINMKNSKFPNNNNNDKELTIMLSENLKEKFHMNEKFMLTEFSKTNNNEFQCTLKPLPTQLKQIESNKNTLSKRTTTPRKSSSTNINKSLYDPLLENILIVACPFLADFRVSIMPSKFSKSLSRTTGRFRYITTKITETNIRPTPNNITIVNDPQSKLFDAFLHSQSLSVRKIVEFVIERVTSAVIKDFQMEILIPSKDNAMIKINEEIESTTMNEVTRKMHEIFIEAHKNALKRWETELEMMIETRVKAALDALLPHETLEPVRKACITLVIQKCKIKTEDWRISNLNGIDFYSKNINSDAEKFIKNITTNQSLVSTKLEIDIKKGQPSKVFDKLQFLLHFSSNRPDLINSNDIEQFCIDMKNCLVNQKLPSTGLRVAGVMTVYLIQNIIQNRCDIITDKLIEKFIEIWLCDSLKLFVGKPDENIKKTDIGYIFDDLITKTFIQSLYSNRYAFNSLSLLLTSLVNVNLVTIQFLSEKFVALFKEDWPEDVFASMSNVLDTIKKKTSTNLSENDEKSHLFMEMLADFARDVDKF